MELSQQIPLEINQFIGREPEIVHVTRLLTTTRVLTLTGAAGCGKTRLALQIAVRYASAFADGVYWCDLAALSDPAFVPQTVAGVLGCVEQPTRSVMEAMVACVGTQQLLIVLDNCEHVLGQCAALTSSLIAACPRVTILPTSLQSLGLSEEQTWTVPPLQCPTPEEHPMPSSDVGSWLFAIEQFDAVRLFVERARQVEPAFTLNPQNATAIVSLCRRLDGIPLAIELAAARAKMLSPAQIVERLDNAFALLTRGSTDTLPRHRTMRAAMDWSYALLAEDEQSLLRRLAVFAGSFTVEMVEVIGADEFARSDLLDLLTNLVDRSLVTLYARDAQGAVRFRILETVRQYAREKLEGSGQAAAIRTRLLEWAVSFAETMQPRLTGAEAAAAFARLALEEDNLRGALQWVRIHRDVERGLRLAAALWNYWLNRGALTEGRHWLEELLAMETPTPASPIVRTQVLHAAGRLAFRQSDLARANELAEASLNSARAANDSGVLASALNLLAILATERGELTRAATLHEQALAIHRQANDLNRAASSLINLGIIERRRGELTRAAALYQEALTLKRQFGDKPLIALTLLNLGENAVWQGQYVRAAALLEESLHLYREPGNRTQIATALLNLSAAARYQGKHAQACTFAEEAIALHQEVGDQLRVNVARINLGDLARDEGDWVRAQSLYANALAQLRPVGDAWSTALALYSLGLVQSHLHDDPQALQLYTEGLQLYHAVGFLVGIGMIEVLEALCEIYARQGDLTRAARGLNVAAARRANIGAPIPPTERARDAELWQAVRAAFAEAAYAEIQAKARTLSLEQTVVEVLSAEQPSAAPVVAPEPALEIYALGPTRVIVGDRVVQSADWKYTKAKELFFYLFSNPPATKAQIGLDLWPDASPDQLRNIFHRAMHYVRKALAHPEWIVFEDDTYTFDHRANYRCDVREFQARLKQAHALWRGGYAQAGSRARAIQCLEAATQLWRGDFLEDLDAGEWAIVKRESLRQAFLQALLDLGSLYLTGVRYAEAVAIYQRVLSLDNYLEVAHRELMRAYARQGDVARAVHHFDDMRRMMRAEFSAEPAAETLLLYQRLRRGDDV